MSGAGATNPFAIKVVEWFEYLGEIGLYLIGGLMIVMLIAQGIKYLSGSESDKATATKNAKTTFIVGGGIFFVIWFAKEVFSSMSEVQVSEVVQTIIQLAQI